VEGIGAYPSLSSPPALDFGAQTAAMSSPVSWLTVPSSGPAPATITGAAQITGADPSDFTIPSGDDTCKGKTVPVNANCFVGVRFTPGAAGPRSATLTLGASNSNPTPATVSLLGTGVAPNSGPTGATGAAGPQGPAGLAGLQGPAGPVGPQGAVELVTCRSVAPSTSHKHGATHSKVMKCTTKLVSGPVKFTTTGAVSRAVLSHGGVIEARGIVSGRGGSAILLSTSRRLKAGRYTLALTGPHGRTIHTVTLS
jgi:hypothetical protein